MTYFKIVRKTLEINGSSRNISIDLRAEVFSYDKNVNKFLFELTSKEADINLTGATVRALLTYVGNDGKKGIIEDTGGVEAYTTNQIYYLLPEELRGYEGTVVMGLYVDLPTGESIDIQNVQFKMLKSSIDDGAGVAGMVYFKSFEDWLIMVKEKALQEIDNIDLESDRVTNYADKKIKEYDDKFMQSNQKMNELQQSQTELSDQLDETNKKIDEADVYRKDEVFNKSESSANVIDTIGGATSTIFKDEMLVNGVEAAASRNNNGTLEPFSQADYDDLDNPDKYVRSETMVNGRGAAIDCEFPVIEILEKRHPWMFENSATLDEKIEIYLSYNPTFRIPFSARGRGILTSNNVESSRSMMHQKRKNGTWIGVASGTTTNVTSNFVTYGNEGWGKTHFDEVLTDGNYTFRVCSKNNDLSVSGSISDGLTPAWVELRDIKLIVEFEANGRTVVESIVAANHVENIASQEEAEAGTDNTKIMTPLRTREVIDKQAVSIAGNQTIGGIKNFQNEPLVDGSPVGLINDACWCEDFAVNSLAAGKVNPDLQRFTTSNENIFSASGNTITIHEAGIYLMALGVNYTGLTSWVSIGISRTNGTSLVNRNLIEASTSGSNSFTYVRSFAGNDELVIEINSGKAGITMQKINLAIVKLA